MLKTALVAVFCGAPAALHAETITCTFTEPFIQTVYDSGREVLRIHYDAGGKADEVVRGVTFHIVKAGVFEARDGKKAVVQRYELTSKGSDGMSERVFPFDAFWPARDLRGGCTASGLPLIKGDR